MFPFVVFHFYGFWSGDHVGCFFSLLQGPCKCPGTVCWEGRSVSCKRKSWTGVILYFVDCYIYETRVIFLLLWLLIVLFTANHNYCLWVVWACKKSPVIYGQANSIITGNFLSCFYWHFVLSHYTWTLIRCLWNISLPASRAINKATQQFLVDRCLLIFRRVQHLLYWELWK